MEDTLKDAFSEVYDIIVNMEESVRNKISQNFIEFIRKNKNDNYNVKINYNEELKNQISKDAKVILSIIYRDYLVDEETKNELIKKDEEYIREKYSSDNIFQKLESSAVLSTPTEEKVEKILPAEIKKDNIFMKIWKAIKNIFKIK